MHTFDSSVGRAEDCRANELSSLGRWFKSGSKEVGFSFLWLEAKHFVKANNKLPFPDRESNPGRGGESAES